MLIIPKIRAKIQNFGARFYLLLYKISSGHGRKRFLNQFAIRLARNWTHADFPVSRTCKFLFWAVSLSYGFSIFAFLSAGDRLVALLSVGSFTFEYLRSLRKYWLSCFWTGSYREQTYTRYTNMSHQMYSQNFTFIKSINKKKINWYKNRAVMLLKLQICNQ